MKIKKFSVKIRSLQKNPKIYYLVGALGDGCLSTEYTVVYIQKCKEWLTETIIPFLNECFNKEFTAEQLRYRDGAWRLKFKSKEIWEILGTLKKESPSTPETTRNYICGYWDTEGSCSVNERAKKKPFINFTQKDKESLKKLKELLNNLNMRTGEVRISDKKKTVWRLWIENTDGIEKFCSIIGSKHPEKEKQINTIE